jgi:hypothetical protein
MDDITFAFFSLLEQLSAQGGKFKRGASQSNAATVRLR